MEYLEIWMGAAKIYWSENETNTKIIITMDCKMYLIMIMKKIARNITWLNCD